MAVGEWAGMAFVVVFMVAWAMVIMRICRGCISIAGGRMSRENRKASDVLRRRGLAFRTSKGRVSER